MRVIFLGVLFCLWFSEAVEARQVRFVTWNIANFWHVPGQPLRITNRGPSEVRIASDYDGIRAVIAQLGGDVFGLQEMGSPQSVRALFPKADWGMVFEGRFNDDLSSGRINLSNPRKRDIYTAIVFRRHAMTLIRTERIRALALPEPARGITYSTREGIAALFDIVGQKIWVVSLHLKSGCWRPSMAGTQAAPEVKPVLAESEDQAVTEPENTTIKSCLMLARQFQDLETWLDAKLKAGERVILLGDFNRELAAKNDPLSTDLNDGDPMPLHVVPGADKLRCDAYGPAKISIDYIVLSDNLRRQLRRGSHPKYNITSAKISDHCPVWADLRTQRGRTAPPTK
jgi:endonuclease/exonuclease/phosphatase family metal-dependent hydrolase